ncbi:MAG: rhodanese-like domain-containing protein [Eubacteriales bacterium]
MKRLMLILIAGLLALSSCGAAESADTTQEESEMRTTATITTKQANAEYRKITPEQAYEMMNSDEESILLDVRTQEEYDEKRIDGALLIPDYEITDKAVQMLPDTDAVILVYCRSGRRSAGAAKKLVEMGYTNIYDFGGIIDWPYETISG